MTAKSLKWWLVGLLCLVLWSAYAQDGGIHQCDRLAAHPLDGNKVVPGIAWNQFDPGPALAACEAAVRDFPTVSRFKFQYARTLLKKGDNAAALPLYRDLADKGYPAAQATLGRLYADGYRGVPQDDAEAVKWYRLAAEQGDAQAQNNLGSMYANGKSPSGNIMKDYRVFGA